MHVWDQYGEYVLDAKVRFTWRLPSGDRAIVRHTDLRGTARAVMRATSVSPGRRVVVYVETWYKGDYRARGIAFVER